QARSQTHGQAEPRIPIRRRGLLRPDTECPAARYYSTEPRARAACAALGWMASIQSSNTLPVRELPVKGYQTFALRVYLQSHFSLALMRHTGKRGNALFSGAMLPRYIHGERCC